MTDDFETNWRRARQQVQLYCYRAAGNRDDGEDIFQQAAVRAWRGYASFRGDCAFVSWAIAIAKREVARVMGRKSERARSESSLEQLSEEAPGLLPGVAAPQAPGDAHWLTRAAAAAVAAGELTECEASVLSARVSLPECSWEQIGSLLYLEGNACAVTHCRAIPKLRVYLFLHRADLLGGREAIAAAYVAAREAKDDPLTQDEAAAFHHCVLDSTVRYRKPGWTSSLRSACGKVIRRLGLP
ncbi:MAG TPA: sigma factor [Chthonomonadaceae bacterium]|nr:sigma factor [Chthonomonadaceae bacterium]